MPRPLLNTIANWRNYKPQFKLFFRFLKLLLPYRGRWLAILILSGCGTILGLVNPYLTKLVIDNAITNKDLRGFIILALAGGMVFVVNGLLSSWKGYLDRYVNAKIDFDLNKTVFTRFERLPYAYFQNKSTGEHLYKIGYDIERVTGFVTTALPQAVSIFPKLVFVLAIVFYLNWKMALLSLMLAPFLYLPAYYFTRRMKGVWKTLIENSEGIFKWLEEIFSHIQMIKVFGKGAAAAREYLSKLEVNLRIKIQNIRLEMLNSFAGGAASKIIIGLIVFYGGYQVIQGSLTLGSLTAIMVYLSQLTELQYNVAYFFQNAALGLVSCRRVAEILDEQAPAIDETSSRRRVFHKGEIIFRDVHFGFSAQVPVLRNVSLRVEAAGCAAVTGHSGCGKTTLLNLLLRLYEPWSGEITIDGYKIEEMDIVSLREQIGVVLQEPFLFNETVAANIGYGREGAGEDEIMRAAEIAAADAFVRGLPKGYYTVIGENACRLSEGQKQKIALARAVIKKPRILILDEAFSAMDSASEEAIIENLRQTQQGVTIITVSHRLSTVLTADLVYFFSREEGLLSGKAETLLKTNGEFRGLFAGQRQAAGVCV